MIGSLRGEILERSADGEVLIEVGGVGYRVLVSPRVLAELEPSSKVLLYIHHHLREDAELLYGFLARDERATFELLLKANGVGPALAMAILATHTPVGLRDIIAAADLSALCLVPGVGRKTAERLVVELKSRFASVGDTIGSVAAMAGAPTSAIGDVREALAQLGYGSEEIRDVLRELPTASEADAATLLRDSLKLLGARRAR